MKLKLRVQMLIWWNIKPRQKKKICLELPELYCFPSEKGEIQAISITTELILRCWGFFCIEGFSALHTAIA